MLAELPSSMLNLLVPISKTLAAEYNSNPLVGKNYNEKS